MLMSILFIIYFIQGYFCSDDHTCKLVSHGGDCHPDDNRCLSQIVPMCVPHAGKEQSHFHLYLIFSDLLSQMKFLIHYFL